MSSSMTLPAARETPSSQPLPPIEPSPLDIAAEHCKGCELCITACPHGVLALDPVVVNSLGYHPVRLTNPAGCTSCVLCARVCPDAVFTIYAPRREARS
jgi:2-oxoglutarate ferredoxin oxidoreductase subunit delta